MSTRAKWIWTIVIVLVVVVLGVAAFSAGQWFGHGGMMAGLDRPGIERGGFDRAERGFNHMMPFNRDAPGFHSPLRWLGMGLGMLLRLALPLGILALAVVGVISLIRRSGAHKPSAKEAPAAAAPVVEPAMSPETIVLRECAGCSKPAQADWKVCPYCGTTLG